VPSEVLKVAVVGIVSPYVLWLKIGCSGIARGFLFSDEL